MAVIPIEEQRSLRLPQHPDAGPRVHAATAVRIGQKAKQVDAMALVTAHFRVQQDLGNLLGILTLQLEPRKGRCQAVP